MLKQTLKTDINPLGSNINNFNQIVNKLTPNFYLVKVASKAKENYQPNTATIEYTRKRKAKTQKEEGTSSVEECACARVCVSLCVFVCGWLLVYAHGSTHMSVHLHVCFRSSECLRACVSVRACVTGCFQVHWGSKSSLIRDILVCSGVVSACSRFRPWQG